MKMTMRSNAKVGDFDTFKLVAGFTDKKDGVLQELDIPFSSFDAVEVDLTPALVPEGFTIEQQ